MYGQERGERVDEDSPTRPRRWNGELLLDAERMLAASCPGAVTVRLGGIYGPGRTRLIDSVRSGAVRTRSEPHFTNRIHRDDAAGALAHLATKPSLGFDRYPRRRTTNPRTKPTCWHSWADRLGVARPAPADASEAGPRRAGSKRCSNARLRAEGYAFRYPSYREGYAAMLGAD